MPDLFYMVGEPALSYELKNVREIIIPISCSKPLSSFQFDFSDVASNTSIQTSEAGKVFTLSTSAASDVGSYTLAMEATLQSSTLLTARYSFDVQVIDLTFASPNPIILKVNPTSPFLLDLASIV